MNLLFRADDFNTMSFNAAVIEKKCLNTFDLYVLFSKVKQKIKLSLQVESIKIQKHHKPI